MDPLFITSCLSLILLFLAAFIALRIAVMTPHRLAGAIILLSVLLMILRRFLLLYRFFEGKGNGLGLDLFSEIISCAVSLLVVLGYLYISRLVTSLRVMHSLLPVCPSCSRVRDQAGNWAHLEQHVREHAHHHESPRRACPQCSRPASA